MIMADKLSSSKHAEARRYASFEEFSHHFYEQAESSAHNPDEKNASFGVRLSREVVQESKKAANKTRQQKPESNE
jgi:tyrosyl-tRNA synthetase